MINGAILYRTLMAARLDEGVVDEIVDMVLRSIRPDPGQSERTPS
jgi:hypothetical protein